jgi:hypothetical protein
MNRYRRVTDHLTRDLMGIIMGMLSIFTLIYAILTRRL